MKKRITEIAVHQTSKTMAILYGFVALVICAIIALLALVKGEIIGAVLIILMPILYTVIIYIVLAIVSLLYNLTAKWSGGIEINPDYSYTRGIATECHFSLI